MAEHFIGGNPYTDPAAGNVKDGSVDYYDFDRRVICGGKTA